MGRWMTMLPWRPKDVHIPGLDKRTTRRRRQPHKRLAEGEHKQEDREQETHCCGPRTPGRFKLLLHSKGTRHASHGAKAWVGGYLILGKLQRLVLAARQGMVVVLPRLWLCVVCVSVVLASEKKGEVASHHSGPACCCRCSLCFSMDAKPLFLVCCVCLVFYVVVRPVGRQRYLALLPCRARRRAHFCDRGGLVWRASLSRRDTGG